MIRRWSGAPKPVGVDTPTEDKISILCGLVEPCVRHDGVRIRECSVGVVARLLQIFITGRFFSEKAI